MASAAAVLMGLVEFGMSVHLLMDERWAGVDVMVLKLVVSVVTALCAAAILLSMTGMWTLARMVDPRALLGQRVAEANRRKRRKMRRDDESVTLLTDEAATHPSDPQQQRRDTATSNKPYSSDAILNEIARLNDESIAPEDYHHAAQMAKQIRDGNDNEHEEYTHKNEGKDRNAGTDGSLTVNVQQAAVAPDDNASTRSQSRRSSTASTTTTLPPIAPIYASSTSDHALSMYFYLSVLLIIVYGAFSILLLAQRGQVADYIHTHSVSTRGSISTRRSRVRAYGGIRVGELNEPDLSSVDVAGEAEMMKLRLSAMLAVIGLMAAVSTKLLACGMVGAWKLNINRRLTAQGYIIAHLVTGLSSALLLSLGVYTSHHQTFVPLTSGEIQCMCGTGVMLLFTTFVGLMRIVTWHPHTSSSYRFPHLLLLSAVSMALVCLTGALFLRGQQTPYYLHPTSTVPVSDALWQLELAAQMKVSLLATIALVITIYTLLTLLLSVQLDAILHQHRQEYATSMQAEAAERKGKRIDRRVRSIQE